MTVDFITKLLLVARKYAILVICNRLWKLHGLSESMISDRELQFTVKLTKKLNKMLGIEIKLSTTFYLQSDGQMERMNQELK